MILNRPGIKTWPHKKMTKTPVRRTGREPWRWLWVAIVIFQMAQIFG